MDEATAAATMPGGIVVVVPGQQTEERCKMALCRWASDEANNVEEG